MVKPGGTGRPRLAISARPAPLPPRRLRMSARPSALPLPKPKTHFDLAGALAEGFLGGAFAGAAGLRGAALPAGRLLIDLIRRDVDLTMESQPVEGCFRDHGHPLERAEILRPARQAIERIVLMKTTSAKPVRCAIYTRVSTEQGSSRTSTHSTPSMMPLWPTSAAKPTPGGPYFEARGFTVFFSCPSNASAKA